MYAAKRKGRLTLTIEAGERPRFRRVLETIIRNYQTPPEALPDAVSRVWYSTAGCQSARMSAEQTRDWMDQLRAIRNSRLRLLQRFLGELQSEGKGSCELRMSTDQAADFMTSLNDHRLFLAAQHEIGEAEMDQPFFASAASLTSPRRTALFEIGALAVVIEMLLSVVDPEAVNWLE
jgi:hypothetical protein